MIKVMFQYFGDIARIHRMWIRRGANKILVDRSQEWARRSARAVVHRLHESMDQMKDVPNSAATEAMKGFNHPLVQSGNLQKSIVYKEESIAGVKTFYGGIDQRAVTDKGEMMTALAMRLNNGYLIPVTDEVRNLMASVGFPLREDTRFLVVPPRPFLAVGIERGLEDSKEIAQRISYLAFNEIKRG